MWEAGEQGDGRLPPQRRDRRLVGDVKTALRQQQRMLADYLEAGAHGATCQIARVHVLQDDGELKVGKDGVEVQVAEVPPAALGVAGRGLFAGGEAGQDGDGGAGDARRRCAISSRTAQVWRKGQWAQCCATVGWNCFSFRISVTAARAPASTFSLSSDVRSAVQTEPSSKNQKEALETLRSSLLSTIIA